MNTKNVEQFLRKMGGENFEVSLDSEETALAVKILNSKFAEYLISGDTMGAVAECDNLRELILVLNGAGFDVRKRY